MRKSKSIPVLAAAVCGLVFVLSAGRPALAGGDWNDSGIAWRPYAEGIAEAKAGGKPVCLVFFTQWCPHCTNYSRVFHDPRIVERAKSFVMIRLDKDQNAELSARYAPDGEYIPRTYFLTSDGTLRPEITERRPSYKYFYREDDPAALLRGMEEALGTPTGG